MGRGNKSFDKLSRSHDKDGQHVHVCIVETFQNLLLQNQKSYDLETLHAASGTQAVQNLY